MKVEVEFPEKYEEAVKTRIENGWLNELSILFRKNLATSCVLLRKGQWIEDRLFMTCPNCDEPWDYELNQTERFKYCPNCGAEMIEGSVLWR